MNALPERRRDVRQWPLIALSGLAVLQFLAIGGLVVVLLSLVHSQDTFQRQSLQRSVAATADRQRLSKQLDTVAGQVVKLTADNAAKDQQIGKLQAANQNLSETNRQFTILLQRNGVAIPPSLAARTQITPTSRTVVTPGPTVTVTSPPRVVPGPRVTVPVPTVTVTARPVVPLPSTTPLLCPLVGPLIGC